jgi:hypothetical protein
MASDFNESVSDVVSLLSEPLNGHNILHIFPPHCLVIVAAYINTGTISSAETVHAVRETTLAITGVRNLGDEIG